MNSSENNSIKFWLDGVRPVPDGYTLCRSVNEAKKQILRAEESKAKIEIIDCDHDLGDYAHNGATEFSFLIGLRKGRPFIPLPFTQ